jgi:hypothetical protein
VSDDAPAPTASPFAALLRNNTLAGVHRPPPPSTRPATLPPLPDTLPSPAPVTPAQDAATAQDAPVVADGSVRVNVTAWVTTAQLIDLRGGHITARVMRAVDELLEDADALTELTRALRHFDMRPPPDEGPYAQISIRVPPAVRDALNAAAAKHVGGRGARSRLIRAALARKTAQESRGAERTRRGGTNPRGRNEQT